MQCARKAHGSDGWCEPCAGLEEIAQKGREQLADQNMPAEPDSATGEKEDLVDSEYGGGQDTEPLRPSSTGMTLWYSIELASTSLG